MKFEKEFVYCVWDKSLVGKLCVFADDIPHLRENVEQCVDAFISVLQEPTDMSKIKIDDLTFPFFSGDDSCYKFVYYDPNYRCKLAFEQGKQIQYFDGEEWLDVNEPEWLDGTKYRVKPDESKPEPEYRPYKDIDAFIYEYRTKHDSFGEPLVIWLKDTEQDAMFMCDGFDRTDNTVRVEGEWWTMAELLKAYTYLDGAPLGVKE